MTMQGGSRVVSQDKHTPFYTKQVLDSVLTLSDLQRENVQQQGSRVVIHSAEPLAQDHTLGQLCN